MNNYKSNNLLRGLIQEVQSVHAFKDGLPGAKKKLHLKKPLHNLTERTYFSSRHSVGTHVSVHPLAKYSVLFPSRDHDQLQSQIVDNQTPNIRYKRFIICQKLILIFL